MLVESVESGNPVSPAAGTCRIRLAADEEELAVVEELAGMEELATVDELAAVDKLAAVEELAAVGEQSAVLVPSSAESSGQAGRTRTAPVARWPRA